MRRRCDRHVGEIFCYSDDMVRTRGITLIVERGITLVVQGEITLIVGMEISKVGYDLLLNRSTLTIGNLRKW